MKKLILLFAFIFLSCNNGLPQETLDKYKGGVIYEKMEFSKYDLLYKIRIDDEVKTVKCYQLEFIYNVGDTIK